VKLRTFLLGSLLGLSVGVVVSFVAIGWTVLSANGVRDIAIESMTLQAQALDQCLNPEPQAKPNVFHPLPKRLDL
jgi:hypothetical protein